MWLFIGCSLENKKTAVITAVFFRPCTSTPDSDTGALNISKGISNPDRNKEENRQTDS